MAPNREEQLLREADEYGAIVLGVLPILKNDELITKISQSDTDEEARVH